MSTFIKKATPILGYVGLLFIGVLSFLFFFELKSATETSILYPAKELLLNSGLTGVVYTYWWQFLLLLLSFTVCALFVNFNSDVTESLLMVSFVAILILGFCFVIDGGSVVMSLQVLSGIVYFGSIWFSKI